VGERRRVAGLLLFLLCSCLLAAAGCGGGGGDDSSASTATSTAPSQAEAPDEGKATREQEDDSSSSDDPPSKQAEPQQGNFTPKPHQDSGGGSEQFEVKGGDNSVQEFGEEAPESEFEQAASALHGFLDARAAGAWDVACSHLSADVAESLQQLAAATKQLESSGCPDLLQALSKGVAASALNEAAEADVGSLRFEGDQAFLIYRGAQDAVYAIAMRKEDGEWKVAGMSGTPIG
jgi:hypothetical protein